jgi:hypothetical protein
VSQLWACASAGGPFKKPPGQPIGIAAYLEVRRSFARSELPFVLPYLPYPGGHTCLSGYLPIAWKFSELPKALSELQVVSIERRCRDGLGRCRDSLGRCRDSLAWEVPRQPWEVSRQPWEVPRQPWEVPRQPWEVPRQPWPWEVPRQPAAIAKGAKICDMSSYGGTRF